jgi:hypothetical protein
LYDLEILSVINSAIMCTSNDWPLNSGAPTQSSSASLSSSKAARPPQKQRRMPEFDSSYTVVTWYVPACRAW